MFFILFIVYVLIGIGAFLFAYASENIDYIETLYYDSSIGPEILIIFGWPFVLWKVYKDKD